MNIAFGVNNVNIASGVIGSVLSLGAFAYDAYKLSQATTKDQRVLRIGILALSGLSVVFNSMATAGMLTGIVPLWGVGIGLSIACVIARAALVAMDSEASKPLHPFGGRSVIFGG